MKASDVNEMAMIRTALAGIPASGASSVSDILFNGDSRLGYDCGIPENPYATDLKDGGKHVLIGDFNKILQLVGTGIYLRQRGASNEFDDRVVLIDKGAKPDSDHWGYPNGAVIDWWNGSTFRKVICIKSGVGENNGNCTVGPDDETHGVNGTGEKYWQLIEKPVQPSFGGYTNCAITDVATLSSGTYTFNKFAKIIFTWSGNITHRDFAGDLTSIGVMTIYVKPNDTMKISGTSVQIGSNRFSPGTGSISSNGNVTSLSLSYVVGKCVWN